MRVGRYSLPEKDRPKQSLLGRIMSPCIEHLLGTPRRLLLGLGIGLFYAVALSLWVVVVSLVRASFDYEHHGVSAWGIIASYWTGGVTAGLLAGLLAPIARWWWGAAFVGMIAVGPFYASAALLSEGSVDWAMVRNLSFVVGMPAGVILRYMWRKIDPLGPL